MTSTPTSIRLCSRFGNTKETSMRSGTWRERYKLLEAVGGSGISFHGRDARSATPVLVHLVKAGAQEPARALLLEVMALPPAGHCHVREFGEDDGASYVITDLHFGAAELPEWLKRARSAKPPELCREAAEPAGGAQDDIPTAEIPAAREVEDISSKP